LSAQVTQRSGIETEAFVGLLRAQASTVQRFNAELVAAHGLTLNDYEVLLRLARAPEHKMRRVDLAEEVLLTPSGITRLLEGLERHGYVERASCATDARVTYAQLTDKGFKKLRAAGKTHVGGIQAHFAERFTREELETLRDLLGRLLEGPADAECAV
jgi:DNA-binding MarR family transcriptional regulator